MSTESIMNLDKRVRRIGSSELRRIYDRAHARVYMPSVLSFITRSRTDVRSLTLFRFSSSPVWSSFHDSEQSASSTSGVGRQSACHLDLPCHHQGGQTLNQLTPQATSRLQGMTPAFQEAYTRSRSIYKSSEQSNEMSVLFRRSLAR